MCAKTLYQQTLFNYNYTKKRDFQIFILQVATTWLEYKDTLFFSINRMPLRSLKPFQNNITCNKQIAATRLSDDLNYLLSSVRNDLFIEKNMFCDLLAPLERPVIFIFP